MNPARARVLAFCACIAWSSPSAAQVTNPASSLTEAIQIVHCLKDGELNWLSDSPTLDKAHRLHVGFVHDRKTFPGEDFITMVVFENPAKGDVFEIVGERQKTRRTYSIVNNGSIDPARKGRPDWVGDVLFGIWTRHYIERHVLKVMAGPKVWVSVKTALKPMPKVSCTFR